MKVDADGFLSMSTAEFFRGLLVLVGITGGFGACMGYSCAREGVRGQPGESTTPCRELAKNLAHGDGYWLDCTAPAQLEVVSVAGRPIAMCRCPREPMNDGGADAAAP